MGDSVSGWSGYLNGTTPGQVLVIVSQPGALGRSVYLNGVTPGEVLAVDGQPGIAWSYVDYEGNVAAWSLGGDHVRIDLKSPTGMIDQSWTANANGNPSPESERGELSGISWNFVAPRFAGGAFDPENLLSIRNGSVYDPKSAQTISGYQDVGVTGWTHTGRAFTGLGSAVTFGLSDYGQRRVPLLACPAVAVGCDESVNGDMGNS